MTLSRRSLFGRICGVVAALWAVPKVATAAPAAQGLALHPDAFALVSPELPARFDVLYGWACFRPERACRVVDYDPNDPAYRLTPSQRQADPARLPL